MTERAHAELDGLALGIDLGASKIELGLVDGTGRIGERNRLDTDPDPERALSAVVEAAHHLLDRARRDGAKVTAAGAGAAGQVDSEGGILRTSPNLERWTDVPIARRLADALDLPVTITNDLNAITLAEYAHGAGRGLERGDGDLVVLYVGTGVGGGVISDGRLLEGAHGYAGELGHTALVAGGRPCSCRSSGCLEAYVSGWAIAVRAREAVGDDPEAGEILVQKAGGRDRITAATVARVAAAGDPLARRLVEETGRLLGAGLVSVIHVFNPRKLVLGGGVIDGIPDLVPAAAEVVRERAMAVFLEDLEIVPATLGEDAGVIGAARLGRLHAAERSRG